MRGIRRSRAPPPTIHSECARRCCEGETCRLDPLPHGRRRRRAPRLRVRLRPRPQTTELRAALTASGGNVDAAASFGLPPRRLVSGRARRRAYSSPLRCQDAEAERGGRRQPLPERHFAALSCPTPRRRAADRAAAPAGGEAPAGALGAARTQPSRVRALVVGAITLGAALVHAVTTSFGAARSPGRRADHRPRRHGVDAGVHDGGAAHGARPRPLRGGATPRQELGVGADAVLRWPRAPQRPLVPLRLLALLLRDRSRARCQMAGLDDYRLGMPRLCGADGL